MKEKTAEQIEAAEVLRMHLQDNMTIFVKPDATRATFHLFYIGKKADGKRQRAVYLSQTFAQYLGWDKHAQENAGLNGIYAISKSDLRWKIKEMEEDIFPLPSPEVIHVEFV